MTEHKKPEIYAAIISDKISELFDEERDDCLDFDDLAEGDNSTHFVHALLNLAPYIIIRKLSPERFSDILECNHEANRLILQYSEREE